MLLGGCLAAGDPCDGALVSGNEECAPGCGGIEVEARRVTEDGCHVAAGPMTWCVERASLLHDDDVCYVDDTTGLRFYEDGHATESAHPTVRRCTEEESRVWRCDPAAD